MVPERILSTPSKLPVRRIRSNGSEADGNTTPTRHTDSTKRKLRNVELDLRDAKQKMLNLQANIK